MEAALEYRPHKYESRLSRQVYLVFLSLFDQFFNENQDIKSVKIIFFEYRPLSSKGRTQQAKKYFLIISHGY